MAEKTQSKPVRSFSIEQEVLIAAPRERVFRALTEEIGKWWAYRLHGAASTITLEPRLGGRFYEDFVAGQGTIWGVVMSIKRPELLRLAGPLGMTTAVTSVFAYDLVEEGGQTRLKLSHQATGFIDAKTVKSYTGGWQELLGKFLKAWVEEGKRFDQPRDKG